MDKVDVIEVICERYRCNRNIAEIILHSAKQNGYYEKLLQAMKREKYKGDLDFNIN